MANLPNSVLVPCRVGSSLVATDVPDQVSMFRGPVDQPTNIGSSSSGGSSTPTGPQWWPITG